MHVCQCMQDPAPVQGVGSHSITVGAPSTHPMNQSYQMHAAAQAQKETIMIEHRPSIHGKAWAHFLFFTSCSVCSVCSCRHTATGIHMPTDCEMQHTPKAGSAHDQRGCQTDLPIQCGPTGPCQYRPAASCRCTVIAPHAACWTESLT